MGYEIHITRAEDRFSEAESEISYEEWTAVAGSDRRLVEFGQVDSGELGLTIAYVWRDHEGPSLVWDGGQITVKGVRSDQEIAEIVAFAAELGATVQGDDGETYDASGQAI